MRRSLLMAGLLCVASAAHAEIAVLANGTTFKVASWRAEGDAVWLALKDGGEVALPASFVQGYVPDEVLDEVEVAAAAYGSDIERLAEETAERHGLDPKLVLAVVSVESAFEPKAVSPKGARGLMQLMPPTARDLGVKDAFDPAENLDGGARHLRSLLGRYDGDITRALAAYNAGQGAVDRHRGVPPYKETRQYVRSVLTRYRKSADPAAQRP